jgi:fructokinase
LAATIIDKVGAGDAFTAALIVGLVERRTLEQMHDHAARLAAFVCGQRGATPTMPDQLPRSGVAFFSCRRGTSLSPAASGLCRILAFSRLRTSGSKWAGSCRPSPLAP